MRAVELREFECLRDRFFGLYQRFFCIHVVLVLLLLASGTSLVVVTAFSSTTPSWIVAETIVLFASTLFGIFPFRAHAEVNRISYRLAAAAVQTREAPSPAVWSILHETRTLCFRHPILDCTHLGRRYETRQLPQ